MIELLKSSLDDLVHGPTCCGSGGFVGSGGGHRPAERMAFLDGAHIVECVNDPLLRNHREGAPATAAFAIPGCRTDQVELRTKGSSDSSSGEPYPPP